MAETWLERYAFRIFLSCCALLILVGVVWFLSRDAGPQGTGDISAIRIELDKGETQATQLNSGASKTISEQIAEKEPEAAAIANADEAEPLPDIIPILKKLQWQAQIEAEPQQQAQLSASTGSTAIDPGADTAQSRFIQSVFQHVKRFKRYPPTASRDGIKGTVWVEFSMLRDGTVNGISILRSSGHSILDDAAVDTFRRAQPLPRIPPEMGTRVTLEFGLDFDPWHS
jgi:protein TonB